MIRSSNTSSEPFITIASIKFLLCSTWMILNVDVRKNKTKGRIIGDIFYVFTQTRMFLEQVRDYR